MPCQSENHHLCTLLLCTFSKLKWIDLNFVLSKVQFRMPGPGFRYGASKSNLDRMFESSGLTGEVKKDMNLYPHLEKPPLPFPKDNIELVNKVEVMNRFADTIEKKLRDQPGNVLIWALFSAISAL